MRHQINDIGGQLQLLSTFQHCLSIFLLEIPYIKNTTSPKFLFIVVRLKGFLSYLKFTELVWLKEKVRHIRYFVVCTDVVLRR